MGVVNSMRRSCSWLKYLDCPHLNLPLARSISVSPTVKIASRANAATQEDEVGGVGGLLGVGCFSIIKSLVINYWAGRALGEINLERALIGTNWF